MRHQSAPYKNHRERRKKHPARWVRERAGLGANRCQGIPKRTEILEQVFPCLIQGFVFSSELELFGVHVVCRIVPSFYEFGNQMGIGDLGC